jgi:uncharacterized protein YcgL (UPF0745 family)|tara:strand:- start:23000 stop:23233 length:234 start_codon:yes stop_codon:yes gene_type:complete
MKAGVEMTELPESVTKFMGDLTQVLEVDLSKKKLAHADVKQVMAAIETQGFYLQLPPEIDDVMREIDKLMSEHDTLN